MSTSLVAQRLKHLPAMWETWVRSLGWEDPLVKEMATHSSILARRIPWTEELGGLQSMGRKELDTTEQLHFHFQTVFYAYLEPEEDTRPREANLIGCLVTCAVDWCCQTKPTKQKLKPNQNQLRPKAWH